MKFCTLASGSSGNATYLSDGDTHILIDAGVSCRAICRELSELGVKADELSAIFITHEHGDHIKGLATLSKNAPNCCIYATSSCAAAIEEKNPTLCGRISSVVPGVEININSVSLVAFDTPHDTPYSVGYRVSDGNKTVMIMTDLGYIPPEIHEYLENLDLLLIEANYD
ncbi:MAG: MBL fold metallo-hydrolase, partial [Clostridia bacterium]